MLAGSPSQAAEYAVIAKSIEVNRSADAVWSRIGDYCAISVWMKVSCSYASGSGDVGTVRLLMDGATVEPMVAKTAHSYTYWQSKGTMAGAEFHGTLAVEPEGRTKSRLSYTLFYDPSALASDAVRQAQHDRLDKRFGGLLEVMKTLSEAK
jgi:hypothetical protein